MKVVSVNIINKRKKRQKYLPLEIRIKMHDNVLRSHKEGLSYV